MKKRDRYTVDVEYFTPGREGSHSVGVVRQAKRPAATVFIETLKTSDPKGKELARFLKTFGVWKKAER